MDLGVGVEALGEEPDVAEGYSDTWDDFNQLVEVLNQCMYELICVTVIYPFCESLLRS